MSSILEKLKKQQQKNLKITTVPKEKKKKTKFAPTTKHFEQTQIEDRNRREFFTLLPKLNKTNTAHKLVRNGFSLYRKDTFSRTYREGVSSHPPPPPHPSLYKGEARSLLLRKRVCILFREKRRTLSSVYKETPSLRHSEEMRNLYPL